MQKAAIYVRDPLTTTGSMISKDNQEIACREYCQARGLTVSATFMDTAGTRNEFTRMISEATRDDSTLDFIVVWKLNRFSMSLEETIELRTNSDELAPSWSPPQREASTRRPPRFHQPKPRNPTSPVRCDNNQVIVIFKGN